MKINTQKLLNYLTYIRYTVAGAIGGIATYNTAMLILESVPSHSGESYAMGVGAIVTAGIIKVLHVV